MNVKKGFTLVELAIVIAVIAILAIIGFIGYRGIQDRARDTQRVTDMKNISQVLEVYKSSNKTYPTHQSSSWEQSNIYPTSFLQAMVTSGLTKQIPVDPVNDSRHHYRYYYYPAGNSGCDATKGRFFILQIVNLDKPSSVKADDNPGFSCSGRNWTNEAWYTTGGFING